MGLFNDMGNLVKTGGKSTENAVDVRKGLDIAHTNKMMQDIEKKRAMLEINKAASRLKVVSVIRDADTSNKNTVQKV